MKLKAIFLFFFLTWANISFAQSLEEITLTDAITNKPLTIASLSDQEGLVLLFYDLKCPFAKMYEERIKNLRTSYSNKGIRFVLVNPNATLADQASLKDYVDSSGINLSFLIDSEKTLSKKLEVSKIPEVFLLTKVEGEIQPVYHGAIDNNPQAEDAVSEKFLERAINQLLRGETPSPSQVRATGCNVRSF
ncbi:redoxin domain-containing protein [Algoriphagus limi]|uniref:Redoxin domain-containing protein n=1 Tax=Algoriphagus limi TaxID=2975273 RepID=A0ABT2G7K9_9BACT|nr:redoxin domain-containing protein [Algoriphagus limi]MCS5489922.1 redoxin domain-containing protein [Algoriphagus limi]